MSGDIEAVRGMPEISKIQVDDKLTLLIHSITSLAGEVKALKQEQQQQAERRRNVEVLAESLDTEKVRELRDEDNSALDRIAGLEAKLQEMQGEIVNLKDDRWVISGLLSRKDEEIKSLEDRVVDLEAKVMQNNFSLQGLEDDESDVKRQVLDFLKIAVNPLLLTTGHCLLTLRGEKFLHMLWRPDMMWSTTMCQSMQDGLVNFSLGPLDRFIFFPSLCKKFHHNNACKIFFFALQDGFTFQGCHEAWSKNVYCNLA